MSDSENQNQSHDDDDHDGNYTIGDDGSNYSVIQRMQHWMGKFGIGVITNAIRSAVEAVILHQSYVEVVEGPSCSKGVQEEKFLSSYRRNMAVVPADSFVSANLRTEMLTKLNGAHSAHKGAALLRKAKENRRHVRNNIINSMPGNLASMDSGLGLQDQYRNFLRTHFRPGER